MSYRWLVIVLLLFLVVGCLALGVDFIYYMPQVLLGSAILLVIYKKSIDYGGSIFHPLPLISLVFVWSMVFSPVVSSATGFYLSMPPKEIDFEEWNLKISFVYLFCLMLFFMGVFFGLKEDRQKTYTRVRSKNFYRAGALLLVLSFFSQVYIYQKMGGVVGYMTAWTHNKELFSGLGAFFMLSELFPILMAIVFFVFCKEKNVQKGLLFLLLFFVIFFVAKIFFGGLRGSRSNTVWGLFWFAGIIHLYYRPLRWIHFLAGAVFVLVFMAGYSVYKTYGVDALSEGYSIEDTGRFSNSPTLEIAQGDFARTGVHAFVLHEYLEGNPGYELKFGQTYMSALFSLVPFIESPFGEYDKNAAGAELFYGDVFNPELTSYYNSRIYGLYGEALMNFGAIVAPLLFLFFGYFSSKLDNYCRSISSGDIRILLVPFFSNALVLFALSDLSNFFFFFVKNGVLIILFVFVLSSNGARNGFS
ncbi:hypothetical protein [uncultured Spongiibacter sp.]|uniref:hypothetical protein n=1 Tax=uncultured Spongiibacter sp. TaxID=870896 RepID=UPI0025977377|nr:hypothetical protein [uncultured Spongiibacter sp.]